MKNFVFFCIFKSYQDMKDIHYDHYFVRLQETIRRQWDEPALCNFQGESITFGEMARQIARMHLMLQEAGVKKGL